MKVRIYQINKELDTENALFMGFDFAEKHGGVDSSVYKCVFDGSLNCSDIEESIRSATPSIPSVTTVIRSL